MVGESISTPCPPPTVRPNDPNDPFSGIPSLSHPWHVKISVDDGIAHIRACNGMKYITTAPPFPWPMGRWTKSEKRVQRLAKRCQRYCDRENTKLARDTQRMIPLAASIRTFITSDKTGKIL